MGLDQYAYKRLPDEPKSSEVEDEFVWRKHAKLQEWMEQLFEAKTGGAASELNCGELQLSLADIEMLEQAVKDRALPHSEGGFFFGHQFQEESVDEYYDQDLRFCAWAREQLEAGHAIYYSCWW